MKITFIFSCSGIFRDVQERGYVPKCSGMFHVPGFIDARDFFRDTFWVLIFPPIQSSLSLEIRSTPSGLE